MKVHATSALAGVLVTGLLVAGCGSEKAPANANVQIQVKGGKPVGGVKQVKVKKGGHVTLTVDSDVSDEIHVHGYDLMKDVTKGGSATISFQAKDDGGFEVELESRKEQIAELQVLP